MLNHGPPLGGLEVLKDEERRVHLCLNANVAAEMSKEALRGNCSISVSVDQPGDEVTAGRMAA